MGGYGKIPRPSGKPKTSSVYPYGQATEVVGINSRKKGKDSFPIGSGKNPVSAPYGIGRDKNKKNMSKEFNKGLLIKK